MNPRSYGLVVPILILYAVFVFLPFAQVIFFSFRTYNPLYIFGPGLTLQNYANLSGGFYISVILYTVGISAVTTLLCLAIALPLSYTLSRSVSSSAAQKLVILLIIPLMLGTVVRTYGWMIILGNNGLVDLLGTTSAVIIGLVNVLLPFMVLPMMNSIEKIDVSVEHAARSLGASGLRTFTRVTLPISRPGILSGSILVFTLSMSAIVTPDLLGGTRDNTIGMVIYQVVGSSLDWSLASALATLVLIVGLFGMWAYLRAGRREGQK